MIAGLRANAQLLAGLTSVIVPLFLAFGIALTADQIGAITGAWAFFIHGLAAWVQPGPTITTAPAKS